MESFGEEPAMEPVNEFLRPVEHPDSSAVAIMAAPDQMA